MTEGIFAIHKPKGPTSHDIVDIVRKVTGEKKVGHAGTLDPLAEGVLVIGVGRESTRQLAEIVRHDKEYIAEVTLGMTSETDDEEGEKAVVDQKKRPSEQEVLDSFKPFIGDIDQLPPRYSATKMGGKKAYDQARKGKDFPVGPNRITISRIELIAYEYPKVRIRVECGQGTYIRSLARDIGEKLGTGGYLSALERTRVGDFDRQSSLAIDEFVRNWEEA